MLQDVLGLNTPLTIQGEILEVVNHFTYLGSCVSTDCSISNETDARISKASRFCQSPPPMALERHKSELEELCVQDYSAGGFVVWQ